VGAKNQDWRADTEMTRGYRDDDDDKKDTWNDERNKEDREESYV